MSDNGLCTPGLCCTKSVSTNLIFAYLNLLTLLSCQFDCLGTSLTDDEILIASSLKQFARFLSAMEEEMEGILVQAQEKFISPLLSFRKEQIGSVKATKKAFEKATTKLCVAQVRHLLP